VDTVLSMLTLVSHFKKAMHRVWWYFAARLTRTVAALNVPVQWHGLRPNAYGFVPLSIAELSCKRRTPLVNTCIEDVIYDKAPL
jgi:hypothetical protein